jgi:GT2 family glycosyltransferase
LVSKEFPEVIILHGEGDLWWAGATNRCVKYALEKATPGDYIFTLNNDTEIASNTFQILINLSKDNPETIIACGNYFINERKKLEATAFVERGKWPFSLYQRPIFPWGQDVTKLVNLICEVNSVSGKGVLIPIDVFRKIGLYNSEKLPQYHCDTEFMRRASNAGFKILLNLNAIIYTYQNASGIGQVNSAVNIKEFIRSFSSLRSENHLPSLYHRARLIYDRKWYIYLVANLFSINIRFIIRYFKMLKIKLQDLFGSN